jgi:hypothetical protein
MNPLLLQGHENSIEISASIEEDASMPSLGDAYVQIAISSSGFMGHNDLWIQSDELRQFCAGLAALDRTLRGEAKLSSMSPDELELTIRSVSLRGHLAVSGKTGYLVRSENTETWHSISFGFEFEPSLLSRALTDSWLRNYAV